MLAYIQTLEKKTMYIPRKFLARNMIKNLLKTNYYYSNDDSTPLFMRF